MLSVSTEFGGASRDRTDDLIVANDALSHLSYSPTRGTSILTVSSFATKYGRPGTRSTTSVRRSPELHSKDRDARCNVRAQSMFAASRAPDCGTSYFRRHGYARVSNPEFADEICEAEANPEGDAEKLVRREAGEPASGEEESHYGTNGCNAKRDRHGADYPFTMKGNFASANVQVSFRQRKKEKQIEEDRGRGFKCSADGVAAHRQRR